MVTTFILRLRGNNWWNNVYRHATFELVVNYEQALPIGGKDIYRLVNFMFSLQEELEFHIDANGLRCWLTCKPVYTHRQ
jgi:hypothetical protein